MHIKYEDINLGVIGLGYVGLPLALEFAKKRKVIGFDINKMRVETLNKGFDKNQEHSDEEIKKAKKLNFTNNKKDLELINCFIITVPTPVNKFKNPDLQSLLSASALVGNYLKKGDIVIFESTVYPGCIEEECVPILEKNSNFKFNSEFFCGYSPERINPGDKLHKISNIKKITSGSTPEIENIVDKLYNEIIIAGTHRAQSIKVAEAAKVIENTQRDLNIALINELAIIFNKMNIDTQDVLNAAKTKWNFLPFQPGLVGGHCIGVDPYYLTYKSKKIGFNPKVILAGRQTNDKMGMHVVSKLISEMKKYKIPIKNSKILIMGLTFKENCSDIRNSGIEIVIKELNKKKLDIDFYDPWADENEIFDKYGKLPKKKLYSNKYDAIIIAVSHNIFKTMGIKVITSLCKKKHIIYDLKYVFSKREVQLRL